MCGDSDSLNFLHVELCIQKQSPTFGNLFLFTLFLETVEPVVESQGSGIFSFVWPTTYFSCGGSVVLFLGSAVRLVRPGLHRCWEDTHTTLWKCSRARIRDRQRGKNRTGSHRQLLYL
ncbi:hypothetical protein GH733_016901 [Mirounga leonina]|nr:hypothetical protein GH733_016901 [Mirounga leonina]